MCFMPFLYFFYKIDKKIGFLVKPFYFVVKYLYEIRIYSRK